MDYYNNTNDEYHDSFSIPNKKVKEKKGIKINKSIKLKLNLTKKKIVILIALVILLLGIIFLLWYFFSGNSSKKLENIIVENNTYAPNFSKNVHDYYLLTSDEEVTINCEVGHTSNISGCNETIDLSNYSNYIHQIVITEDEQKEIYKIYIKVQESDSEENIVINGIDGINSKWTKSSETITINASSENEIVGYSIDNGESFQKSSTFEITENTNLKIVVKDSYGNKSAVRQLDVTNIDKVVPTGIIVKEKSNSDKIVLKVIGRDEESGVSSYSWNGGSYSEDDTYTITSKGEYYVTIKDKAGNISSKISVSIKESDFNNKTQYAGVFYLNGSDSVSNDFLSCTVNDGSCNITLPTITREGAKIIGWSSNKDDTTAEYEVGEKITLTDDIVLYAITSKEITITFNKNGADSISATSEKCTLYNDGYCYVAAPTISYSSGKIIGWNVNKNSDTVLESPNSLIKVSEDETYYALVFKEFVVTFNINGADSISSTKESCRVEDGTCYITTPTITRENADIIGWSTSKSSKVAAIGEDTQLEITENRTYYAITNKTITITFNKNGADSISSSSVSCDFYNEDSQCSITTPSITRSSSTIIGWSLDSDSNTSDVSPNTEIVVTDDQTYYAITYKKVTLTFNKNGASSISSTSESCSYYNDEDGCTITTPSITRSSWKIVGWNTNKDATSATLDASTTSVVKSSATYYAITYKKVTATFNKNTADSLGNCSTTTSSGCTASCNIYNQNTSCQVSIPYIYSKGNEVQFFSTGTDETTTVGYSPANKLNLSSDITLYAIVYNRYRSSTYSIIKTKNYGYTAFETESGCTSTVYNNFYSFTDTLYSKAPYIFRAAKVTFTGSSTFNETWGSYAGMTYGQNLGYRNVDVKCPTTYSTYYLQTIVHELTHSWDSYYRAVYGTALSDMSDMKALYNKYYSASTRPLRDYSYTNMSEFVADVYAWYYFLYVDTSIQPSIIKSNTYYPSDMKSVMEKYINIAKNGY